MIQKFKSVTAYLNENREINLCPKFVVKNIEIDIPYDIQEKLNVDWDTAIAVYFFLQYRVMKEKICEKLNKDSEWKHIKPENLNIVSFEIEE